MSGSTFGRALVVSTFGESHGGGLGVVVDGCPPGIPLDLERVQAQLDRRRPGTGKLVSGRKEADRVEVLSGLFEGRTLGTPIGMIVRNRDANPASYAHHKDTYRPSHADYTWDAKMGLRAWAGGGRASARETAARVAAGAVAEQILEQLAASLERDAPQIVAWVDEVQRDRAAVDADAVQRDVVEESPVRCPDAAASERFEARIRAVRAEGDTVGGVVRCVARGVPAGLGEPVFDKLDAELAKAMLSIPAAKGVEVGSGFGGTALTGRAHNDLFEPGPEGEVRTATNRSGGIQGGISNGMPIELSVAFKPVATVFHEQATVDRAGRPATIRPRGRHDPCVLPREVPIVEAMVALVLADHWLRWRGQVGRPPLGGQAGRHEI